MKNTYYGFVGPHNDDMVFTMEKGQNMSGFTIGIVHIEKTCYPYLPGNVVNGDTYDFPVRLKAVKDLESYDLFEAKPKVSEALLNACLELEKEGVRAISGACGFFGNYQKEMASKLDVPIALSSLVQIPWILPLLKDNQKIGVLTANKDSFTDSLLLNCGIVGEMKSRLIVKDLGHEEQFQNIINDGGKFDNAIVKKEVVGKALEIIKEEPDTGAILLECSDMPPYAYLVQAATHLPVFDFTTLVRFLHSAVAQKPYFGFI